MASNFQLRLARQLLLSGGIISYQTDTLYGLSCNPYNHAAIDRINQMKQRASNQPCILLASRFEQLATFIQPAAANFKQNHKQIISAPGKPTSWIVAASRQTPDWLIAEDNTIAIRISDDPITASLCTFLNSPVISSSANMHQKDPANSLLQLRKIFGNQIDLILQSSHKHSGKPSRIQRLCDNKQLRA